jgi:ethanolamine utilization protein EutN
MILCKVTGTVTSTRKSERFRPAKLLIVHPVDVDGNPDGVDDLLALDPKFNAGVGDFVLVAREGKAVQQVMEDADVPANVVILGVVDQWSIDERAAAE